MCSANYDIFLGGSCNPTTWRRDIVIPILKRKKITYYNPQVAHWDESLIQLEYEAKRKARILFFVFDPSTRNVASMGEVAFLAAAGRRIVIVLENYSGPGQIINGHPISSSEYEELSYSLRLVQNLSEKHSIPVFTQITHALCCAEKILRSNAWPQTKSKFQMEAPMAHERTSPYAQHLMSPKTITLLEVKSVFQVVTNREMTSEELQSVYMNKTGQSLGPYDASSDTEVSQLTEQYITFDEFCCILREFDGRSVNRKLIWCLFLHSDLNPIQKYINWAVPTEMPSASRQSTFPDIYLGGSVDAAAMSLIHKSNLTFYNASPVSPDACLSSTDEACIDRARVLLFVTTSSTRDCSVMVLANYSIGLKKEVIVCLEMLPSENNLTNRFEVQDYNRGRAYLRDQALSEQIPVFYDIKSAVQCAVEECSLRSSY